MLSNRTRKLLRFKITKMLILVINNSIVSFIICFGTLSFPVCDCNVISIHNYASWSLPPSCG